MLDAVVAWHYHAHRYQDLNLLFLDSRPSLISRPSSGHCGPSTHCRISTTRFACLILRLPRWCLACLACVLFRKFGMILGIATRGGLNKKAWIICTHIWCNVQASSRSRRERSQRGQSSRTDSVNFHATACIVIRSLPMKGIMVISYLYPSGQKWHSF